MIDEFSIRFPSLSEWIGTLFQDDTDFEVEQNNPPKLPAVPGYRMLERIAVGGMGIVYKAVHVGLDRIVALKMVRGGSSIKEEEIARFRVEARAIACIKHPHLSSTFTTSSGNSKAFLTSRWSFSEGGSLSQRLALRIDEFSRVRAASSKSAGAHDADRSRSPPRPSRSQAGQHPLGQRRRPQNQRFPGWLRRLGHDTSMTVSGVVMGTANYMAPEQARGDRNITGAVDIYALGAILYECLTGRLLFREESYEKMIRRVMDEEPVRPREILALIPPELEAVCLKCLEKTPQRRYARAVDLADDLRRFLNGEPLSIGTFDVIDQHERWAGKVGLADLDLLGHPGAFVYRAREKIVNRNVVLEISTGLIGSPARTPGSSGRRRPWPASTIPTSSKSTRTRNLAGSPIWFKNMSTAAA